MYLVPHKTTKFLTTKKTQQCCIFFVIRNYRFLVETPKPYHWDYTKFNFEYLINYNYYNTILTIVMCKKNTKPIATDDTDD